MADIAVIGAGPVGCLTALGLAQRGQKVTIFEGRSEETFKPTTKNTKATWTRSINLAISVRGLTALSKVDKSLAEVVLANSVPMKGRMIHPMPSVACSASQVQLDSQLYSVRGECIYSVSRELLSKILLDEVERQGIEVKWSHRLHSINLGTERTKTTLAFEPLPDRQETISADILIGCDGHHSRVREAMVDAKAINVRESVIESKYLELHVAARENIADDKVVSHTYAMDPNHLHIWPRGDFMLIALPNQDATFTSTLFAPQSIYTDNLSTADKAIQFFRTYFADALDVIGEDNLVDQVVQRRNSPLGMIECSSYHVAGSALLLGDAAHAMVPFYGQGLNCGLEDVRILLDTLDEQSQNSGETHSPLKWQRVFATYSQARHDDLVAICQLAMDNYVEMSTKVVRQDYLFRKRIDGVLEKYFPQKIWASLYTLVTFSNLGYHAARRQEARQARIVQAAIPVAFGSAIAIASYGAAYIASICFKKYNR